MGWTSVHMSQGRLVNTFGNVMNMVSNIIIWSIINSPLRSVTLLNIVCLWVPCHGVRSVFDRCRLQGLLLSRLVFPTSGFLKQEESWKRSKLLEDDAKSTCLKVQFLHFCNFYKYFIASCQSELNQSAEIWIYFPFRCYKGLFAFKFKHSSDYIFFKHFLCDKSWIQSIELPNLLLFQWTCNHMHWLNN